MTVVVPLSLCEGPWEATEGRKLWAQAVLAEEEGSRRNGSHLQQQGQEAACSVASTLGPFFSPTPPPVGVVHTQCAELAALILGRAALWKWIPPVSPSFAGFSPWTFFQSLFFLHHMSQCHHMCGVFLGVPLGILLSQHPGSYGAVCLQPWCGQCAREGCMSSTWVSIRAGGLGFKLHLPPWLFKDWSLLTGSHLN